MVLEVDKYWTYHIRNRCKILSILVSIPYGLYCFAYAKIRYNIPVMHHRPIYETIVEQVVLLTVTKNRINH